MKTIHVAVKELPQALRDALKAVGYGARDIGVIPQEAVEPNAYAGEGQKGFVVIVNLETGKREILGGDWGGGGQSMKPIDAARQDVRIPEGGAVIIGTEGWPRTMASIYVHPETIAKMLPAGEEVTDRERSILRAVSGLTSAGRKEEFGRMGVKPAELEALVDRKLLSRNKAGALSITLAGKNMAECTRVREILARLEERVLAERSFHFHFKKGRHGTFVAEPVPGVSVELERDARGWEVVIYDDDMEGGEVASRTPLTKGIEQSEAEQAAIKIYTDYMWGKDDERRNMGESVDMDWDDLESEVRDLVAVVRRKQIQAVLEAVDRINDLILKHVEL